jgi:hypothetical protein
MSGKPVFGFSFAFLNQELIKCRIAFLRDHPMNDI